MTDRYPYHLYLSSDNRHLILWLDSMAFQRKKYKGTQKFTGHPCRNRRALNFQSRNIFHLFWGKGVTSLANRARCLFLWARWSSSCRDTFMPTTIMESEVHFLSLNTFIYSIGRISRIMKNNLLSFSTTILCFCAYYNWIRGGYTVDNFDRIFINFYNFPL